MKYKITEKEYIKAVRRVNREDEIKYHGKQISLRPTKIKKSKKTYNRKKFRKTDVDY